MAYKTSFRPLERLGRDGWKRMTANAPAGEAAAGPVELGALRERQQLLIDA